MNENIKRTVRSWLNVVPASPYNIQINELLDFEANAIRNRIWYRGDSSELEQLYMQNPEGADKLTFKKLIPKSCLMQIKKIRSLF